MSEGKDGLTIAVRLTNWVGDCVMNTPFLTRLRALFPGAHIVCLGRAGVVKVLEHNPAVDEVWSIDDKSTAGFREAVARLRHLRADFGFLLPNSFKSALLFRLGGVRRSIGYARHGRRLLLSDPVELRPEDLATHEVHYYLRLLSPWERTFTEAPPLSLSISQEERAEMDAWLAERGIGPDTFLLGVNPAALYGTAKRWAAESYATAAGAILAHRGGRVVVTGLSAERSIAQAVCDAGGESFVNGAGRMSLRQLMAFLQRANLFLTNDSGAMHIAAALGTPLVAVFGSTDWVTTAPLGEHCRIVRAGAPCAPCLLRRCPIDHRCMTTVSPPMVIEAAEELLSRYPPSVAAG